MSPMPMASVTLRAPAFLELFAKSGLAAPRLAGDEYAHDAGGAQVDISLAGPLDEVGRVGGRQDGRLRLEQLDRQDQTLGVPCADGNVAQADALERRQSRSGDERARVVGRDDALAGLDARGRVAPR